MGYTDLSTVEHDGKRKWVYPILRKGLWYYRRLFLAIGLIAFLIVVPWTTMNGHQTLFLDVLHFRIFFFGHIFHANEAVVILGLVFSILAVILLLTALYGRVFCGWACPQTVFMEFVFRPIEKLFEGEGATQKRLHQIAWHERLLPLFGKHGLFLVVALVLSNTFIAYFFGAHHLIDMVREGPQNHWEPFIGMSVVTAILMFQFGWFREQVCTFICPYGRLQSLLLDRDSLIVAYDTKRGEPRGKPGQGKGDCVDCKLCIHVCPTGIDIRNGLQLECVSCTQCIDACDSVMDKLGRSRGLIRYDTENSLEGGKKRIIRPRLLIYGLFFALGASLIIGFGVSRQWAKATIHREASSNLFTKAPDGRIINTLRVQVQSLTDDPLALSIEGVKPENLVIQMPTGISTLEGHKKTTLHILAFLPAEIFLASQGRVPITLHLNQVGPKASGEQKTEPVILETTLFGPTEP